LIEPDQRLRAALASRSIEPPAGSAAAVASACATPAAALMVRSWQPDPSAEVERGTPSPAPVPARPPPSVRELQAAGLVCLDAARAHLAADPDQEARSQLVVGRWGDRIGFHLVEEALAQSVAPANLAQVIAYLARERRRVLRGGRLHRPVVTSPPPAPFSP